MEQSGTKTTLYIVRHGTTEYNIQGLWQGEIDTELAQQGIDEATAAADSFVASGVRFDAAYSSDLRRAFRTAEILCGPHEGVQPVATKSLRECSLGEFEGLHKTVIHGPKYAHIFERLRCLNHEERIKTGYTDALEAPSDVCRRVTDLISELLLKKHRGGQVLLVTHSVVIESLLAVLLGKLFDGISMRRLAWIKIEVSEDGELSFIHLDGFTFEETLSLK